MTFDQFLASINDNQPNTNLNVYGRALWYDAKGEWQMAHDLVDGIAGVEAAWVHAYLHRKEGDQWNADYWYRRANRVRPNQSLDEEWADISEALLETSDK